MYARSGGYLQHHVRQTSLANFIYALLVKKFTSDLTETVQGGGLDITVVKFII
jgi:hypothetical protein